MTTTRTRVSRDTSTSAQSRTGAGAPSELSKNRLIYPYPPTSTLDSHPPAAARLAPSFALCCDPSALVDADPTSSPRSPAAPEHDHDHPYHGLLSEAAAFLGEDGSGGVANLDQDAGVAVSIYRKTTPETCSSIAVGVVHCRDDRASDANPNGDTPGTRTSSPAVLFVKDRRRRESIVQATNYRVGSLVSSALSVPVDMVVAESYSIPRPRLADFEEGSAGWRLWRQKEEIFEERKEEMLDRLVENVEARRRYMRRTRDDESEVDEGGENVENERPSNFDCWQLEAAARYLPVGATFEREEGYDHSDVDSSLRAKLRRAASRSRTGTLHLWDVLALAGCCQTEIRNGEDGWEGSEGMLVAEDDALTRNEVLHLLDKKLNTPEIEASALFCAITAQPDAHHFNLAVREFDCQGHDSDDQPLSWGLALVNFDTGTLPADAGLHFESCEYLSEGHEMNTLDGFAFDGDPDCRGYYYPTLVQLLDRGRRLSPQGAEGLLGLDGSAVQSLVEREYAVLENERCGMVRLGAIIKERIRIMQDAVREARSRGRKEIGLRELCFRACGAWKRDWEESLLDDMGETLVWMRRWAKTGVLAWDPGGKDLSSR